VIKLEGKFRLWIFPVIFSFTLAIITIYISSSTAVKSAKKELINQATIFTSINKSIKSMYNETKNYMENVKKKEVIKTTKLIAESLDKCYERTKDENFLENLAKDLVDLTYSLDKFSYSYIGDLSTGYVIIHPFVKPFKATASSYRDAIKSCPENFIKYEWNMPESEKRTIKQAYVKCLNSKNWMVGTSMYMEDISERTGLLKQKIFSALNASVQPKFKYIKLDIYKNLPEKISSFPKGKIVRNNEEYLLILHSDICDKFYVYRISIIDALKKSFVFYLIALILALVGLTMTIKLKTDYERSQTAIEILEILSGTSHEKLQYKKIVSLIKEKTHEIVKEMKEKENMEKLLSNISSESNVIKTLKSFLDNFGRAHNVLGLELFVQKKGQLIKIISLGNQGSTFISHDEIIEGSEYRIVVYTPKYISSNDLYAITKGLEILSKKIADILKSMIDPLTKVWNRHYVYEFLDKHWKEFGVTSVMMLDLDGFKKVNDRYGHDEGDVLLKRFVDNVSSYIRAEDILIRWGGDEFIVVMKDVSKKVACATAERIRSNVEKNPDFSNYGVTVSIGVVHISKDSDIVFIDIIKISDKAMYKAKAKKNSVECLEI